MKRSSVVERKREMENVLTWLRGQPGGNATYIAFVQKMSDELRSNQDNAAVIRMLMLLTDRLIEAFDRDPLPSTVNQQALTQLIQWMEKAVELETSGPVEKLEFLNKIAGMELVSIGVD